MEKLNIAEILKDCPTGMELDCTMYDNVSFDKVSDDENFPYPIFCYITDEEGNRSSISFTENGYESKRYGAKCVIFPKGKTTWEGFQRPFKDGDIIYTHCKSNNVFISIFKEIRGEKLLTYCDLGCIFYTRESNICCDITTIEEQRLATEEEKQELFDVIKAKGYRWNPETKTLEKLEKEKFDISTLKPFESKVLVRSSMDGLWKPAVFGFRNGYNDNAFYIVGGSCWKQCIPFLNNEHLCGTTNDCDEYFKTWE